MRSQAKDQIDLFSGIGGFALAARWAGFETVQFVELDPFCQKVLNKNFPGVPIHDDIKTFTYTDIYKSGTQSRNDEEMRGFPKEECESGHSSTLLRGSDSREQPIPTTTNKFRPTPFILTGGFPCQPFSCAGKRKGKEDDRYLWPEMLRVISEARPTWVIGENVGGFVNMGLDECISDLEAEGYEVQPFIIPACSKNAPHRRDRVWIVAHTSTTGTGCDSGEVTDEEGYTREGRGKSIRQRNGEVGTGGASPADSHAPDTESRESGKQTKREGWKDISGGNSESIDSHTSIQGLQRGKREQSIRHSGLVDRNGSYQRGDWTENWLEVAQRFCKLDARIPAGLDGCLTEVVPHGIMGFILLLRRFHYAKTEETRTGEILPVLREAFAEKDYQRTFRRLGEFCTPEELRCSVHGKGYEEGEGHEIGVSPESKEIPNENVRKVQVNKTAFSTPQGRGLHEQCSCEFDDIVCELSSEIALGEWKNNAQEAENILYRLWQESRGERFLHEPLPALYEIWRSVTDQEIGSFRRHYNKRNEHRVQKLKSLGNAIVPQIAYEIMKGISEL